MTLYIRRTGVPTITLDVRPGMLVRSVKERIQRTEDIPVAHQSLVFKGKRLQDNATLGESEVPDRAFIYLVLGFPDGMEVTIVEPHSGDEFPIMVAESTTIGEIRETAARRLRWRAEDVHLLLNSEELDNDEKTMLDYNARLNVTLFAFKQAYYPKDPSFLKVGCRMLTGTMPPRRADLSTKLPTNDEDPEEGGNGPVSADPEGPSRAQPSDVAASSPLEVSI